MKHNRENELFEHLKNNILQIFLILLFIGMIIATPKITILNRYSVILNKVIIAMVYITVGWILIRIVNKSLSHALSKRFTILKKDNLVARKIQTKLFYIKAIINVMISLIILALVLNNFDSLKSISMGILASAGVIGIILGFAAQKSISNILAGFLIAFTQPIRIDDVVIVEGEWGKIEEINLTYVVVKIWDQRRMILPITYFISTPFQNWTRKSADILGTVYIYTDYTVPVDKLREELNRILKKNPLWDKKVGIIQVTDTTEKSIELRALISAKNSSDAWDLRCFVREKLIDYIRKNYPGALPKTRAELNKTRKSA